MRGLWLGWTVAALFVAPAHAAAQDADEVDAIERERALALFAESEEAYEAGEFGRAAFLLEEAYSLVPEPTLLFNLGRARERDGDARAAIDAYEEYLEADPDASDAEDVRARIAALRTASREEEAASREEGEEPVDALMDEPEPDEPDVLPGPASPTVPPPRSDDGAGVGVGPFVLGIVGLAGLTATGAFVLLMNDARTDAEDDPVHRTSVVAFDTAERYATMANVSLAVGVAALAGAGAWLTLELLADEGDEVTVAAGIDTERVWVRGRW